MYMVLYEKRCSLLLSESALKSYFGKVLLIHFASTWSHLLQHCISVQFLLLEGYCSCISEKSYALLLS